MSWEERKKAELDAKTRGLVDDLAAWYELSLPGQALEKHHSQLARIRGDLGPVAERLARDVERGGVAATWRQTERATQDLLHVWGYFRDKLALRLIDRYAPYLLVADDFAWACYQPVQVAATAGRPAEAAATREPPLVCMDDVGSPFSLTRESSYVGELGVRSVSTPTARSLLRALPVPVITVPWFQVQHLPDALIVAHEVGHHVARDFGLEATAASVVAGSGAGGFPAGWATEAFCDVFGTLCAGSSFVVALADFLRIDGGATDTGTAQYPPTVARLALCLGALRAQAPEEAERVRSRWANEQLDLTPAEAAYGTAAVAAALTSASFGELGGRKLVDVVGFGAALEGEKDVEATELLAGRPVRTKSVRVLLAAAGAAFARAPGDYGSRRIADDVLARARSIRDPGVRWRVAAGGEEPDPPDDGKLIGELYEIITGAGAGDD